ncbi:RNA polymerase III transcription factor IIIC subunit-domain-containing protein [Syncephalastrum racemosum]|uniref:RNA polymerase III transcription factor IIIC subunit-domain-containing protein n=1 Tax=Syncephalastrum racemosum TaxID=13706 RepID=A0A1X2HHH8_SYNRA|nr:RNA polymerase III transcription factor IIIC subunit-domain-containing protein [Syncephalastrum racemosum]
MADDPADNHTVPVDTRRFLCVEYPARVKRVDRAIRTLGGEANLASIIKNSSSAIELRHRPTDPYAHPMVGEVSKGARILLKVSRRKGSDAPSDTHVEALGTVENSCRFRGISDFQYIVPKDDPMRQLRQALDRGTAEALASYRLPEEDDPQRPFGVPGPVFSSREMPLSYLYNQPFSVAKIRVEQPDGSFAIKLVNRRARRPLELHFVNFAAKVYPTEPIVKYDDMSAKEKELTQRLQKLFDERPICTRRYIFAQINAFEQRISRIPLAYVSYIFKDGPWPGCYVRYGVDPRTDPKYHILQAVKISHYTGRASVKKQKNKKRSLPRFGRKQDTDNLETGSKYLPEQETTPAPIFDEAHINLEYGKFQMIDIKDPDLLPAIHNPKYLRDKPSKLHGYYYQSAFQRIVSTMGRKAQILMEGKPFPSMPDALNGLDEEVDKEKEAQEKAMEKEQQQEQQDRDEQENDQEQREQREQQASEEQTTSTQDKGKQRALATGLSHLRELEGLDDTMFYGLDEFEFGELVEGGILEEYQDEDAKGDDDKQAEEDEEDGNHIDVGTANVDADLMES